MLNKTYWNGQGRFQKEYNELETDINFIWTKAEENAKYRYYRYYNDGDIPQGAYYASKDDIQIYLELQANIVVAKGYCRKHKGEAIPAIIKFFANKTFQGFTVWQSGGIK